MHELNEQKEKRRQTEIRSDRSGHHWGEIKGGKEDETCMEGAEKGIVHFAKPMTAPRGGLGKSEERHPDERREEKKRGGGVSADYLSTSVINAESGILEASQPMCMCVFENQMTWATLK